MLRLLFNWFEPQFIRFLNKKNAIKLTKDNLSFAFHDNSGHGYYKFPKEMALPMVRLGKLMGFMTRLSSGITGEELEKLLSYADQALTDGIKNGKNASKIGFIISEIRDAKTMVVHDELFYNIIALQFIRQDESPTKFNNDIHMEKVKAFKELNEQSDSFFLSISEYLKALNWSNITREELLDILNNSSIHRQARNEVLENLFGKLSETQKATLNSL